MRIGPWAIGMFTRVVGDQLRRELGALHSDGRQISLQWLMHALKAVFLLIVALVGAAIGVLSARLDRCEAELAPPITFTVYTHDL